MTQLTEHSKSILRAIADGKTIQRQFFDDLGTWKDIDTEKVLGWLTSNALPRMSSLRIKPETRSINGVEIPAPHLGGSYLVRISFENGVQQTAWGWTNSTDRDTAYQAIVDALGGKTNAAL